MIDFSSKSHLELICAWISWYPKTQVVSTLKEHVQSPDGTYSNYVDDASSNACRVKQEHDDFQTCIKLSWYDMGTITM